jgi:acyl-CoA synthetase (AMP-forming)/AMP-acid ligase II
MSLESMIEQALVRDPALPAFEFDGRWHTWGEVRTIAEQVRAHLDALGISPSTPVMMAPRTRPSAVAALLGLTGRGWPVRMAYAFQSAARLLSEIDARRPAALIAAEDDFSPELVAGLAERGIAGIALGTNEAKLIAGLESGKVAETGIMPPRHIETLTSGTTGKPKPFLVPYETISDHLIGKSALLGGSVASGPGLVPLYLPAPLSNISGIYGIFPTAVRGHPVVLVDRFTVAGWHDYLKRYRPAFVNLPAVAVQQVLDAEIPVADLAGVQAITTGAAPLASDVHRAFEKRYGVPILLGYGATEFAGSIAQMTLGLHSEWGERKFGSVGRVAPGAEMRIVHPDTGEILPAGQEGLLEARTDRFDRGWIRTSDLAVIDEDGFLFHRGRADSAIVRGGFKILPETIEQALMLHPAVSQVIAAGVADRRLG